MAKTTVAVGLDISTGSIKVSEVDLTKREPVITKIGVIDLPDGAVRDGEIEDASTVSSYLKELWRQNRIHRRRVVLGISNQKVIVRPMDLPYMVEDELENAVKYQVQEFIPIPIDDAIVDYEVVEEYMTEEEERMQTVLLAAAHREMIQSFIDVLNTAGLVPEAVELKAFALARSLVKQDFKFMSEEGESKGSACLVNIGSNISNICVVKDGTPRFVRMLMRGGDFFAKLLNDQLKIPLGDAEDIVRGRVANKEANTLLQKETRLFVGEIWRSLEYYMSQTQERDLAKLILSGSGSRMINLPLELNKGLNLPLEIGHPLQNVELGKLQYAPEELAELEASIAVCVGLALRDTEE